MRARAAILVVSALLFSACASTRVATEWTNPSYRGPTPRKLLVVASVPTEAVRYTLEEELSRQLQRRGFQAVPITTMVPAGQIPSKEEINQLLERGQFDGLLISRFVGTSEQATYVPGSYGWYGYPYAYGFGGAGYYDVSQRELTETSLFDARQRGILLWTVTSSTLASGAGGTAISDRDLERYADVIAKRLGEDVPR